MRVLTAAVPAVAVLVATASGCTTTEPAADGQPEKRQSTTEVTTAPATAPTTTSTPPRPVDLPPVTPPGTVLRVGQPAVVPATGSVREGSLVEVTVTLDSRPVTEEDLRRLPLSAADKAQLRGNTFVFIRTSYVNLTGADLGDMDIVLLSPTTRGGGWPGALLMLGAENAVAGCESVRPDESFNRVGAKYGNCEPHFGSPNDPVVTLAYDEPPYSADAPLTWQVG